MNRNADKGRTGRILAGLAGILLFGCLWGCGEADPQSFEPHLLEGTPITGQAERPASEVSPAEEALQPTAAESTPDAAETPAQVPVSAAAPQPADDKPADDQPADEEAPGSTEAPEITLIMVGDILLHTPVEEAALQPDGTRDFSPLFAHTSDLIAAPDLALVNQEVIIGGEELGISGYPAFNAPTQIGDALVDAGFDVVLHATNHALDKGKRGLENCMAFWDEAYPEVEYLGIHDSEEDSREIFYYTEKGADPEEDLTVAILNYTYGTNGIALPADMPYGVDLMDDAHRDRVEAQVREAQEHADFVIVCPHWGTEYELGISSAQRKWTKIFADCGADLIIGTHPHVIEPVEWAESEETGDRALVYYSLGNFVNWTSGTGTGVANRMVGGMARVTIGRDPESDMAVIKDYGVTALVAHLEDGTGGVTVYPLREYTPELGEKNRIRSQDAAFSYDYCTDLCDRIWGSLWD
ncbi:MAG: CapA family protein [Lachnospiraceae bacterium]|nr:CapA family protein [Lachnospiraceae bacterium]